MSNLKRILLALFMVCAVVGLSGCSGGGFLGGSDNSLSGSFSPDSESIWYEVDSDDAVGKDSQLLNVFVFKDGKASVYDSFSIKDMTLGSVSQMDEKEIISKLEEYKKQSSADLKALLEKSKKGCDLLLAKGVFDGTQTEAKRYYNYESEKSNFEAMSKGLENYELSEITPEFKYAVYTDSTGNVADKEVVSYKYTYINSTNIVYSALASLSEDTNLSAGNFYEPLAHIMDTTSGNLADYGGSIGSVKISTGLKKSNSNADYSKPNSALCPESIREIEIVNALDPTRGAVQVYDTTYSGYICEDSLLLTKTDGKSFLLDEVGADGVIVDPTEENLFDQVN